MVILMIYYYFCLHIRFANEMIECIYCAQCLKYNFLSRYNVWGGKKTIYAELRNTTSCESFYTLTRSARQCLCFISENKLLAPLYNIFIMRVKDKKRKRLVISAGL